MKRDYKDIAVRAAKTFVQAGLAFIIPKLVAYLNGAPDFDWKAILYAALAAGISAVWNLCLTQKGEGNEQEL